MLRTKQRNGTPRMPYTLAAAAAATGLNKTTILRAIKSGKISGSKDEHDQWQVEPVELHRVYPPLASRKETTDAAQREAAFEAVAAADLQLRIALADQQVSDLKAILEDMRSQRDAWKTQAERLALTDHEVLEDIRRQRDAWQTQAERLLLTDRRAKRSWWRRLMVREAA